MISRPLPNVFVERALDLRDRKPDLEALIYFYSASEGGRKGPVPNGFGCPCLSHRDAGEANDARFLFDVDWVELGSTVVAKVFFLFGEDAARKFAKPERFYLWESKIIGEAVIQ